ncbi:STM4015 family protein [Kitasatospora sp. NBC_01302]|uniref:STM4015 family protein n=1 Tax=Kitasatospora sp. NBC_01302 TaxID=2903575 RepID=UPI002E0EABFB|nr:STM4015 family protein [Kitasatospora sp. NBC_01302]
MSTISGHLTAFHGLPVFDHTATLSEESEAAELPAAADAAWKIGLDYDSELSFEEAWQAFLDSVDTTGVRAVVIGNWWGDDYDPLTRPLAAIVAAAGQLPALQALFIGDVVGEECELSWLQMTDITPVLESFAQLEELVVRGASAGYGPSDPPLSLRPLRHERLRALRFEAGGLPGSVVRSVTACEFPALERLELWLGVEEYGGDATIADLAPLLAGAGLPALRHLGLENSELQDEIAAAVAGAPVVAQLDGLSLAMGTLTDEGATALLEGQPLTHLSTLDLHHHFLTEAMVERLRTELEPAGVAVDLSEQETPDEYNGETWRYTANAE